jgi:hypothetical protein
LPAPTAAVDSEARRPSARTLCSGRPSTVSGCTLGSAGLGSSATSRWPPPTLMSFLCCRRSWRGPPA